MPDAADVADVAGLADGVDATGVTCKLGREFMEPKTAGVDRVLAGKYRLISQLGEGGMGSVWRAEHLVLRSMVAVKLMSSDLADTDQGSARFLREARAAAALRSPHVVQILDFGLDEGEPFIVMELLEGESLSDRLARVQRLPVEETVRTLTEVARAMGRAHEAGIIHRDLKPENVFLVRNDDDEIAKVLDFGVAKAQNPALGDQPLSRTRSGLILGTPYYMSPEQVEGAKTIAPATDIWSFGVIAYECLLGTHPFEAPSLGGLMVAICARPMPVPSAHGPVPPGFDAWFACACAREPERRFATIRLAAAALREVCLPSTTSGFGESPSSRSLRPSVPPAVGPASVRPRQSGITRRSPEPDAAIPTQPLLGRGFAVAVLAVGMFAAGAVLWWRWSGRQHDRDRGAKQGSPRDSVALGVAPSADDRPGTAADTSPPATGDSPEDALRAAAPPVDRPVAGAALTSSGGLHRRSRGGPSPSAAALAFSLAQPSPAAPSPAAPSPAPSTELPSSALPSSGALPSPAAASSAVAPENSNEPCLLSFSTIPATYVLIDGKPIGSTPRIDVPTPPGAHTITFIGTSSETIRRRETISCKPGEAKKLTLRLDSELPTMPAVPSPTGAGEN